MVTNRT